MPGAILFGLLLLVAAFVGFWFGSLSDDATLRSWFPPRPTPSAVVIAPIAFPESPSPEEIPWP